MTAYGYVRKSVMRDDDTTMSPAVQRERIEALAASHGDKNIVVLEDLGISGAKIEERTSYMEIVAAIESGEATAVYAYDLSRLHRNLKESLHFFDLAAEHGVAVRLVAESIDTSTATGEMMRNVLASMNQWMSKITSSKVKATFAAKRARGDTDLGGHFYGTRDGEDIDAVVSAYVTTESFSRAARVLNANLVPTRNSKSRGWSSRAVEYIVRRVRPDLMPDATSRGIRGSKGGARETRFARLLRCSECGSLLTGHADDAGRVRYYCHQGVVRPHGRATVNESSIIASVGAELDHLVLVVKRVNIGSTDDDVKLAELDARRTRIIQNFEDGDITRDVKKAKLDDIADEESKLAATKWIRKITMPPAIDGDPKLVNAYLRRVFASITVDMRTPGHRGVSMPVNVEATWRDPSLRIDEPLEDGDLFVSARGEER